jgi:plastocyanin
MPDASRAGSPKSAPRFTFGASRIAACVRGATLRAGIAAVWLLPAIAAGCGGDGSTSSGRVAAVLITTASATLRIGEQRQFTAVAIDESGNDIVNAGTVTWESAAPSVASVSTTGRVVAVAEGATTISATIQGVTGNRLVTVLPPSASAVVTMPGFSFVPFQVEIRRGEQVFFEFPREPHNVIFERITGAPQDIQVMVNVTIPRRFDLAGNFTYDCTIHPGMTGLVIVSP